MLKHIVMWKFKEHGEGVAKFENILKIKAILENLPTEIPEILKMEVGFNINALDDTYDVVLYSEFLDEDALEVYQKHPKHLEIAEYIGKIRLSRVVVDYIV